MDRAGRFMPGVALAQIWLIPGGLMTAIFGSKKSRYTCPECGSDDTELVSLGAEGRLQLFGKILDMLQSPAGRRGQFTLVCHKCGHRSAIFIQ